MKKSRRHFTAEEKVALLRRHLVEKKSVSEICREHHLQPTVFYRWQQEFFENGPAVFQRNKDAEERRTQERIAYLENRIQRKDEVLAELMLEHVALKKSLGEL
ncbi:MAG: transposase [Candidatus Hydrogenedentales bacterium]|jgi:transposase